MGRSDLAQSILNVRSLSPPPFNLDRDLNLIETNDSSFDQGEIFEDIFDV